MSYELGSKFKFVFKGSRGYRTFMKQDNKQKLLDKHPEIKDKLKKLRFLAKYDIKTTIDAFERREINYLFVASQIQEIGYSKFDKSL